MAKNNKLPIFFTAVLLFVLNSKFALALEITYPRIPGLPEITATPDMNGYIGYFFGLGIMAAGALALISLAIGAGTYILGGANPGVMGDAKDRIKGSILGLILTMVSFIILQSINANLVSPTLTPLAGVDGIFYYKNDSDMSAMAKAESNTLEKTNKGYTQIYYKCTKGPNLIIWRYPQINFGLPITSGQPDYSKVSIELIPCGEKRTINAPSFRIDYQTAGVYYFLDEGCKGFMSNARTTDDTSMGDPFRGRIKSVKIINDNTSYGVIFHKSPEFAGGCTGPITKTACENVYQSDYDNLLKYKTSFFSASIFQYNTAYASSGEGVKFYSTSFGYKTGQKAGYFKVEKSNDQFSAKNYWERRASAILFDYSGVEVGTAQKEKCATFKDCPGSIEIGGKYLVLLTGTKKEEVSTNDCVPIWTCGSVGMCRNGKQSRTCTDLKCGKGSRTETQTCDDGSGYTITDDTQYGKCQIYRENVPNIDTSTFLSEGYKPDIAQVWPIK